MTQATESLPVIFRTHRHGEYKGVVTAVFPTLPGTPDPWSFTVYEHVGQHSDASKAWYLTTCAAKPEQFADLLRELRGIYETPDSAWEIPPVNLQVAQRFTRHHDKARRAALRAQRLAA